MSIIKTKMKSFNFRTYFTLIALMAIPTIYTVARIFWLGDMPDDWGFNIASQLIFISLIFEVIDEALILPLFNRLGIVKDDIKELSNRMVTGLLTVAIIYGAAAIILSFLLFDIANIANVPIEDMDSVLSYIRIELVALLFIGLNRFIFTLNIATNNRFNLWAYLIIQTVMIVLLDALFISSLPFSLNLGVNGVAITNIIVNFCLFACMLYLFIRQNRIRLQDVRTSRSFKWMQGWFKQGIWSGGDSFIRNVFYFYMIAAMVNVVAQQGNYWVVNNFIWGILLIPVLALGQLVKMETAQRIHQGITKRDNHPYFLITALVVVIWLVSIPLWQTYYLHINNVTPENIGIVVNLTLMLLPAYIFFAFNDVADSFFYGTGKTQYLFLQAVFTNLSVYGIAFIFYTTGTWIPTLESIALLFGIGVVVDSLFTFLLYYWSFYKGLYEQEVLVTYNR